MHVEKPKYVCVQSYFPILSLLHVCRWPHQCNGYFIRTYMVTKVCPPQSYWSVDECQPELWKNQPIQQAVQRSSELGAGPGLYTFEVQAYRGEKLV